MFKRKRITEPYDKETQRPTIRASICSGEQVAGFRDIGTGKFTEVMVIRNQKDMAEFLGRYGIQENDIKKEW
ncbi:MAG: aspartate dehydrogenase [Lachnospiraceae bacterium]|nr:aspartate dehydrogenase [Lachnospiraceae bacterium]